MPFMRVQSLSFLFKVNLGGKKASYLKKKKKKKKKKEIKGELLPKVALETDLQFIGLS